MATKWLLCHFFTKTNLWTDHFDRPSELKAQDEKHAEVGDLRRNGTGLLLSIGVGSNQNPLSRVHSVLAELQSINNFLLTQSLGPWCSILFCAHIYFYCMFYIGGVKQTFSLTQIAVWEHGDIRTKSGMHIQNTILCCKFNQQLSPHIDFPRAKKDLKYNATRFLPANPNIRSWCAYQATAWYMHQLSSGTESTRKCNALSLKEWK